MTAVGIQFNYKKVYRRNLHWCITIMGLSIILLIATLYIWLYSTAHMICLLTACILQNFVFVHTTAIYNILLYSLYQRFSALNSYLRLALFKTCVLFLIPIFHFRYIFFKIGANFSMVIYRID